MASKAASIQKSTWRKRMAFAEWWSRTFGDYAKAEREALPDGTRVRLTCAGWCGRVGDDAHAGIWVTSWTPRRTGFYDDPDDYQLEREGDGKVTFAHRNAIEPVP